MYRYFEAMDDDLEKVPDAQRLRRLADQADKMVEAGRLTVEEAARLKTARGAREVDAVVRDIRVRHAGTRLDAAVADGAMSREEADGLLERLRGGEHSRALRSHLGQFRPRRRPPRRTEGSQAEDGDRPV